MAANILCTNYLSLLSPFIDGELSPGDRVVVEQHLPTCRDCTARVADLRAESGLVRVGLEMAADDADFSDFAQRVMARIESIRPPLLERWRVTVSEWVTYQRGVLVGAM